jgi:hypothetical protein
MQGEEDAEGQEERRSQFVTYPKIIMVDGKMIVIAQKASEEKKSNLTLRLSTALISPFMPN